MNGASPLQSGACCNALANLIRAQCSSSKYDEYECVENEFDDCVLFVRESKWRKTGNSAIFYTCPPGYSMAND